MLVVLQAMHAAGKDGTIKHVMSGVNPQGCQVFSFKKPSDEELDPQLSLALHEGPPRAWVGLGIFDRSYDEEVVVGEGASRVVTKRQKLPPGKRGAKSFWQEALTTTSTTSSGT